MQRRRRIKPKEDAKYYIDTKTDKVGLDVKYISAFKGRGIFATTSFQKGDFLSKEDGSLGRLINDDNISPNAKMKYLTVQQKPHLCLFATRDINQGEEITYNYGDSDWPWRLKELEKEMSQSPDCTHSTSTTDNTEQVRAENDQDQMTTSVPNETDPVLDSLPINSEVFYN
ncbi:N-lysine methyltransferase SETD8-A-like isoform X2 [Poecilia latipinna]|uniref:N-lysine methyltransferase SETD8-A-like isoform X2 n=1 Tax=Poecilia latipinna TaxID=48699 RepID=UPI00072E95BB|nr:PREDICTED: N-lysine methyltransferase SETD8-A-like isoform X2 [Poecilia latipinna]